MLSPWLLSPLLAVLAAAPGAAAASAPRAAPVAPVAPVAKLRVVTTIPDLADIVRTIGGPRVDVQSLTRGGENLHSVIARPTHVVALSRADVYVQIGLSLESAFAPTLLINTRNQDILPGGRGFVNVSDGWEPIQVPTNLSRLGGDLHPMGNPHMNLDPRAGRHMATVIRDSLAYIDAQDESGYRERFDAYAKELDAADVRWKAAREKVSGRKVAVFHQEFNYLTEWLGIEITDSIELRPGIPPSPNHLAQVIDNMKRREVKVILSAPWSDNSWVERVAEATGAQVVLLPNQTPEDGTWIGTMDEIMRKVVAAFSET